MFGHETFPTVFRDVHQVKQNPVVFILSYSITASSPIKRQKLWECAGVRLIEVWLYLCLPVINNSASSKYESTQTTCNCYEVVAFSFCFSVLLFLRF